MLIGNGQKLQELAITKAELPTYLKYLKKAKGSFLARWIYPKTQVVMNRALQFLNSEGPIYSCSAGDSLITVDEFGNIMPCRRMPIICGNVHENTLKDLYYNHDTFIRLRRDCTPFECTACPYSYYCRGGAKCQSYAYYSSFYKADPACPIGEINECEGNKYL